MDHAHCANCINVKKCKRSRGTNGCEIILCKLECLAQFHMCKEDEHTMLCKNEKVSCINVEYGCLKKMKRSERGQHLEVCPASVVICSKEWNRWSIKSGTDGNLEDYTYVRNPNLEESQNDHQLDTSLALYDQHSMLKMYEPFANEGVILGIQLFETPMRNNSGGDTMYGSATEQIVYAALPAKTCQPPNPDINRNNSQDLLGTSTPTFVKLTLETVLDSVTYQRQPSELVTFRCGRGFRRDTYTSHYKNVHDEIHAGLNGWLQERCPLACYGCDFSRHRFYPDQKGYKVIYSPLLECMAVKCNYPSINDTNTGGTTGIQMVLTDLPSEVLQYMTHFLDSFSLSNLALTNTMLRDICGAVLQDIGIVIQKWQRIENPGGNVGKWIPSHKCWMFSKGFSSIQRWGFEDNMPMSDHLNTCPFNDRNVKEQPYLCGFFGVPSDPYLEAKLSPCNVSQVQETPKQESSNDSANNLHETLMFEYSDNSEKRCMKD